MWCATSVRLENLRNGDVLTVPGPGDAAVNHGWHIDLYLHVCHMLLDLQQLGPRMLGVRSWN
jgi:hypothetical protein